MKRAIVCGVDGSPDSQAALGYANELAARLDARLVLAHVVEQAPVPCAVGAVGAVGGTPAPLTGKQAVDEAEGERLLDELAEVMHVEAERRVVSGLPAERLADLADDEDAELIVVGSRGRGSLRSAFLGSVSASLIGLARCPVVVVPRGALS